MRAGLGLERLRGNLKRIYAVLPARLRRRVVWLFFGMTFLGMTELASIMALTGFFTVLNMPEHFIASAPARRALEVFPALTPVAADPRLFVLCACLLPIGLILLKNVLSAHVAWRSSMLAEEVAAHVGLSIIDRFLNMPYDWHLSAQSSRALTSMQWRFSLGQMLLQILTAYSNLITVCLLFVGIMVYSPGVTLGTVVFMLAASLLTYQLLRRRIDRASAEAARAQREENTASMTAMGGVRELIIYQQQPVFLKAISEQVNAGMRPRSFLGLSAAVPTWTLESCGFLLIWLAMFLLIFIQNAGLGAITTTVALLTLTAWRVLPSLNRVVGATVSLRGLQGTALPCLDYFEELASDGARYVEADSAFRIRGEITFEHVSYRYPGAEKDALTDISCTIPRGTTLGLVGRSGAGKSTFINILSGLLEPTSGRLLVDGKPMSAAELAAYRRRIGYVPQSPYLLPGTVAQNVAFSDWGKPIDEARVRRACREAAIDFLGADCADIARPVSQGGNGLSGGQLQRVSIARALYAEPEMLIFDEATSALDQASEAAVQETVRASAGRRICVIAAHRLSTLDVCDLVIWLESGGVRALDTAPAVLAAYAGSLDARADAGPGHTDGTPPGPKDAPCPARVRQGAKDAPRCEGRARDAQGRAGEQR